MSGIDGSRTAALAALPKQTGPAAHPARQNAGHRSAAYAQATTDPDSHTRAVSLSAGARPAVVGFLAQAIAQESLLLGARGATPDHRGSADLYRQRQDEDTLLPGPQIRIDLKI